MGTQKTNLQNVKCVAHMLLYVDIQTTAFSPMVVSHPFTNDGIVRLLDDTGNITLADLVNNPDDLDRWRQKVSRLSWPAPNAGAGVPAVKVPSLHRVWAQEVLTKVQDRAPGQVLQSLPALPGSVGARGACGEDDRL